MLRYAFGPFRLEPTERRLVRDGEPVDLTPKEFDLLVALVERAGELVTKDELIARLWDGVVVDESALTVHVSRLRAAFGESARAPGSIETVPRAGYRFVAPVRVEDDAPGPAPGLARPRRAWTRAALGGAAVGAAVVVALALTLALQGTPSSEGPAEPLVVPAGVEDREPPGSAEEAYVQARQIWWQRRGFSEALWLFRSALVLDSTFAPAHVGIADVLGMSYQTGDEARAHVRRALALDPDLGEAYASLGLIRTLQDWDFDGAEAAFDRALALAPDYAPAHQWRATLLMIRGRPGEAVAALDRALAVAPPEARPSLLADRCQALYYARRYPAAVADCRRALDLDPAFGTAPMYGFWALVLDGRPGDAARWATDTGSSLMAEALTAAPAAYTGPDGRARLARDLAAHEGGNRVWRAWWGAQVGALAGDRGRVVDGLRQAVRLRQFHVPFVAADPLFDAHRDDPEVRALLREAGLE